jgi:hypothetical protein
MLLFLNKGNAHDVSTVQTGNHDLGIPGSHSTIFPMHQEMMALVTEPAFQMTRYPNPGAHGDIPGNLYIPVSPLRVG